MIKKSLWIIRYVLGQLKYFTSLYIHDIKQKYWYQYYPRKPLVINLNANDICNSKCVMCNIWENKQDFEFSPDQLFSILKDPLFSDVQHVGITGGEPTLRTDLPLLYESCIRALPNLIGLSIITNAIKDDIVISRIEEVADLCKKNNKKFSMMVSLDGYGVNHDKIRRRDGNFHSAIKVVKHFQNKAEFPVSIGCTISKDNVWDVDELLHFLKEEKIYGRFRVAEFITRLYNEDKKREIRNFTDDEAYHLTLFFKKLELTFEKNETFKRTYRSIQSMLLGGSRKISCPYHTDGVVLNSKGELQYCAPKSNVIGNSLNESAWNIYKKNLKERRRIINNECESCIHDYHAEITYKEKLNDYKILLSKKFIGIDRTSRALKVSNFLKKPVFQKDYRVFIVGWYGTETVGDKAILSGIISEYKEIYKENIEFIIGSLFPFITERTCKELQITAKVIDSQSLELYRHSKYCNETVMGGGPLMDLEVLHVALNGFKIAKRYKRKTVVYGCGIGPLTKKRYLRTTKEILKLADILKFRDQKSVDLAKEWTGRDDITLSGDLAIKCIKELSNDRNKIKKSNVLACFLREWPYEYARHLSPENFKKEQLSFESGLAQYLLKLSKELGIKKVVLHHMHNFVVGSDDRDFSRRFIKKYFSSKSEIDITYNQKLSTVESIVDIMNTSKHNLCMRFHSVLFAHTLGVEFTAIDYTFGGKIYNFLKDNSQMDRLVSFEQINVKNNKEFEGSSYLHS